MTDEEKNKLPVGTMIIVPENGFVKIFLCIPYPGATKAVLEIPYEPWKARQMGLEMLSAVFRADKQLPTIDMEVPKL